MEGSDSCLFSVRPYYHNILQEGLRINHEKQQPLQPVTANFGAVCEKPVTLQCIMFTAEVPKLLYLAPPPHLHKKSVS
jgi:hypothetical protein